jgi:glycosyltransferase involved in cell wall biosynthesis
VELRDGPHDVRLVIVGEGSELDALRGLARAEGVEDRVHILGPIPHAEVGRFYAALDVMIFPRGRNLVSEIVTPLKPLEAMAMGKLVLVSDVGGLLELVGDAGHRFRAGDAVDFARVVREIADDFVGASETVPELRKRAQERDWLEIAKRYPPIYEELLDR